MSRCFRLDPLILRLSWILALGSLASAAFAQEPDPATRHWAFVPPTRPATPSVSASNWGRNPIDAFVLDQLEEAGIDPATEADRATLLRRLSFDLTGLPASPEALHEFLSDETPIAYERVVERLLCSPAFGEHAAQQWLDLARYADTDGYEFDAVRPNAWRYRDWVVRALNSDIPYDRFVRLQLAGDELEPGNLDAFLATGFHRNYPDMVDQNDQTMRRQNALNDITETTGLVFLGLTLGCARCHDHKTDPISQRDFYSLQAFFAPARFRDDFPVDLTNELAFYERMLASWNEQISTLESQIQSATEKEKQSLTRRLERLKKEEKPIAPQARGLDETSNVAAPTYILRRGEFGARGDEALPAFPSEVDPRKPIIAPLAHSTGRRTALAQWLTHPDHPLAARVYVNRLWQHFLGKGIVATSSDFGLGGDAPSHPELLDWLACELVEQGWSTKAVIRQIVTSATYRQSASFNAKGHQVDPENSLLWRHSRRRLDGEAIRDALLAASGRLNRAMGGPGVFPELPQELAKLNAQGVAWPVSTNSQDHIRRSLYVFVRRNLRYPFFEVFDRPDTNASCPRRASTTTAPQALTLLNNALTIEAAQATALRVREQVGPAQDDCIDLCFELILGTTPEPEERRAARELWAKTGRLQDLCLALFNVNKFIYVD